MLKVLLKEETITEEYIFEDIRLNRGKRIMILPQVAEVINRVAKIFDEHYKNKAIVIHSNEIRTV